MQMLVKTSGDVEKKFAETVAELDKAKTALQAQIGAVKAATKEKAGESQAELKVRLQKTTEAATALAVAGSKFAETQKEKLPEPASKSVNFILSSPNKVKALADEVKDR